MRTSHPASHYVPYHHLIVAHHLNIEGKSSLSISVEFSIRSPWVDDLDMRAVDGPDNPRKAFVGVETILQSAELVSIWEIDEVRFESSNGLGHRVNGSGNCGLRDAMDVSVLSLELSAPKKSECRQDLKMVNFELHTYVAFRIYILLKVFVRT